MHQPILSNDTVGLRLPAPNPPAILIVAVLWLTFACGLPLYRLREARRQAHQDLQHLLAADKPDNAGVIAAFDRSNQNLEAVVSGPCLLLAFTIIFLVNQMFKLKRRYSALARELPAPGTRDAQIKIAQTFRTGTNDIDALDYVAISRTSAASWTMWSVRSMPRSKSGRRWWRFVIITRTRSRCHKSG